MGWVGIFDLQKNRTLKHIRVMSSHIDSMTFSRNNQSAFISDNCGNIKMIKWQAGSNSGDHFHLTEESKQVGNNIKSICLTKDEKYLLIGERELVYVFETITRKIIKKFNLTDDVQEIILIKNGKKAIIAEKNGDLSVLDLETIEISSIAKNITKCKALNIIIVI